MISWEEKIWNLDYYIKLFDVCKLEILMRELVVENRLSYKVAELYIIEAKNYVKE